MYVMHESALNNCDSTQRLPASRQKSIHLPAANKHTTTSFILFYTQRSHFQNSTDR
jgi:hypothetical protein